MSNQKLILATAIAALGTAFASFYLYTNYFGKQPIKQVDQEKTKKILQEIKHQMLITCINFTNQMKKRAGQINFADPQTIRFLNDQMGKIYKQKQNLVLAKYDLDSQSYSQALKKQSHIKFIKDASAQIIDMMERATSGRLPVLTVKDQVKNKFTKQEVAEIYYELCQKIVGLVLKKLKEQINNDPNFDSRDDQSFRKAIRSISIYDYKVEFLADKGFLKEWGCPNQNFFKLIEGIKAQDAVYKEKVVKIQKSYQKAIEQISNDPAVFQESSIKKLFEDSNPNKAPQKQVEQLKSMNREQQKSQEQPQFISESQIVNKQIPVQSEIQQNVLNSVKSQEPQQQLKESKEQQQSTKLKKTDSVQMQKNEQPIENNNKEQQQKPAVFVVVPQQKRQAAQQQPKNQESSQKEKEENVLRSVNDSSNSDLRSEQQDNKKPKNEDGNENEKQRSE